MHGDAMPETRVVDGIERYVLCDVSAPSPWVPVTPTTNGEAPKANDGTCCKEAADGGVCCSVPNANAESIPDGTDGMAREVAEDVGRAMGPEVEPIVEVPVHEVQTVERTPGGEREHLERQIAEAKRTLKSIEYEAKRLDARRGRWTRALKDLRRRARKLRDQPTDAEDEQPLLRMKKAHGDSPERPNKRKAVETGRTQAERQSPKKPRKDLSHVKTSELLSTLRHAARAPLSVCGDADALERLAELSRRVPPRPAHAIDDTGTEVLVEAGGESGGASQGGSSKEGQGKGKSSKFRGVTWEKDRGGKKGYWRARIWDPSNHRKMFLGSFNLEEHAAVAHDLASLKIKGRNAKTNFGVSRYDKHMESMKTMSLEQVIQSLRATSKHSKN